MESIHARRNSNWRIVAESFLAWSFIGAAPALGDDTVDLNEISRRLDQWRASFFNLRMVYELRSLKPSDEPIVDWPAAPEPESARLWSRDEWIWAEHGLDLIESWSFPSEGSGKRNHSIKVFNGPKDAGFEARFQSQSEGSETLKYLHLHRLGTETPPFRQTHPPLHGLYWSRGTTWLPEKLKEWTWTLEGFEDVGGERCARITAGEESAKGITSHEMLWLDLQHDCLVRRAKHIAAPKKGLNSDFIIDEFQQLPTGIWFPKRGRLNLHSHSRILFVVTDVELNQPLDLTRFDPPDPVAGTRVHDYSGHDYTHGVPVKQPTVADDPPASGWDWWQAALASAVLILLARAIGLRTKQSGSDPSA